MNKHYKFINLAILVLLFLSLMNPSPVYARTIDVTDGRNTNGEWDGIRYLIYDKNEVTADPNSNIPDDVDIHFFYTTYDATNIYFRIDTYGPLTPATNPGYLRVFLDKDNNSNTGCDDNTGHEGKQGFESYFEWRPGTRIVSNICDGGVWPRPIDEETPNPLITTGGIGRMGDFYELRVPRANLGIAGPETLNAISFFLFFEGGNTVADDQVPDSGTATLITLGEFTARPKINGVLLEWNTLSEVDNAGFNLWRSETPDGQYEKINASLIPAQGGPTQSASYEYLDQTVAAGVTYYYKLEDIDTHGNSTFHSQTPIQVQLVIFQPFLLSLPVLLDK